MKLRTLLSLASLVGLAYLTSRVLRLEEFTMATVEELQAEIEATNTDIASEKEQVAKDKGETDAKITALAAEIEALKGQPKPDLDPILAGLRGIRTSVRNIRPDVEPAPPEA